MKSSTVKKNTIVLSLSLLSGVFCALIASYVMVVVLGGDSGSILPSVVR